MSLFKVGGGSHSVAPFRKTMYYAYLCIIYFLLKMLFHLFICHNHHGHSETSTDRFPT